MIHVGTNEISTNKKLEQIAKLVAELALSVKNNSCDVALSDMTKRCSSTKSCRDKPALEGIMKRKNIF